MAKEKPIHQQIAEKIVAGLKKPVRDQISIAPKASYTILSVSDEGWCARVTKSVAEFRKKRISEADLEKLGLHGDGAKPMHRTHHIASLIDIEGMADGEAKIARESDLKGVGVEEMVAAVELAAKSLKTAPKASGKNGGSK